LPIQPPIIVFLLSIIFVFLNFQQFTSAEELQEKIHALLRNEKMGTIPRCGKDTRMTKERIIDMHAHVFPEKIAEKATLAISAYYGVPMASIGTVENLIRQGALAGIKRFLIHSTATNPDQVRTINEYIAATVKSDKRFWGFGTLHPFSGDIGGDGEHLAGLGLLGVKFHPEFQKLHGATRCLPLPFSRGEASHPRTHGRRKQGLLKPRTPRSGTRPFSETHRDSGSYGGVYALG
jgi:hypothetical protein